MKLTPRQASEKKTLLHNLLFLPIGFGREEHFINICKKTMSEESVNKLKALLEEEIDNELFSDDYICGEAVKRMQKDMKKLFKIIDIENKENGDE